MRESIDKMAKITDAVIANKHSTYLDHEQDH